MIMKRQTVLINFCLSFLILHLQLLRNVFIFAIDTIFIAYHLCNQLSIRQHNNCFVKPSKIYYFSLLICILHRLPNRHFARCEKFVPYKNYFIFSVLHSRVIAPNAQSGLCLQRLINICNNVTLRKHYNKDKEPTPKACLKTRKNQKTIF